ncbi:MAG: hypothetical protein RIT45_3837 [Pseudomonadota bacterium]
MNPRFRRSAVAGATAAMVVAFALQACGGGGGGSNPGAAGGSAAGDVPVQFDVDAGSSADSTAAAEVDSAGPGDAVQPSDASVDAGGPNCPGSAGCPCTHAADCDAGLCLESPEGKRCASPCVSDCPSGYRCAPVPQGACTHAPLAQGSACDADGNPCTVGDSCEGGSCAPGLRPSLTSAALRGAGRLSELRDESAARPGSVRTPSARTLLLSALAMRLSAVDGNTIGAFAELAASGKAVGI